MEPTQLTALPPLAYNIAEVGIYYSTSLRTSERFTIRDAGHAVDVLRPYFGMDIELREMFWVIYLNQASHVLAIHKASIGGITGTVADIRLILSIALQINANQMVVAHNHPSGNLTPSGADIELTRKLKGGAALMDMRVLDHLILCADHYLSMADEGLL